MKSSLIGGKFLFDAFVFYTFTSGILRFGNNGLQKTFDLNRHSIDMETSIL